MTRKQYEWELGSEFPVIQQHSVAKHDILRAYLSSYIQTLISNPNREEFRLVLVDGFAGGGIYRHADTRNEILGSPFIMLEAAQEAEKLININRRKPVKLDIDYFFIEKDASAAACLLEVLRRRGYEQKLNRNIFLSNSTFESKADELIERARKKMPKSPRAIFLLDQYGYSDVPTDRIAKIIQSLPGSEVILTFAVDALLNYFSDHSDITKALLTKIGIPTVLRGRTFEDIKKVGADWRLFIQACVYRELVEQCRAKYYTLFFIRSSHGHGDYWLIHFSQKARARDVMTRVHWENNNHFIHYGGAGLEMFEALGYVPEKDDKMTGQSALFCFDDIARKRSTNQLVDQIAPLIYADPDGITFAELFATTCNLSPASADIYKSAISQLRGHREIEVISAVTGKSTHAKIQDEDHIRVPDQRSLFMV